MPNVEQSIYRLACHENTKLSDCYCCVLMLFIYGPFTLFFKRKKSNFSEPIFPGDPGSLTLTPSHVPFVKWF